VVRGPAGDRRRRENLLPALPEFRDNLKGWVAEPPTPEQLTVVGSYRFLD
jgi:hypothetical protein